MLSTCHAHSMISPHHLLLVPPVLRRAALVSEHKQKVGTQRAVLGRKNSDTCSRFSRMVCGVGPKGTFGGKPMDLPPGTDPAMLQKLSEVLQVTGF